MTVFFRSRSITWPALTSPSGADWTLSRSWLMSRASCLCRGPVLGGRWVLWKGWYFHPFLLWPQGLKSASVWPRGQGSALGCLIEGRRSLVRHVEEECRWWEVETFVNVCQSWKRQLSFCLWDICVFVSSCLGIKVQQCHKSNRY